MMTIDFSSALGNLHEGLEWAKTAVECARALPPAEGEANLHRQKLIAKALYAQGQVGLSVGNMSNLLQVFNEAIAISRAIGYQQILGYSLVMYFVVSRFTNNSGGEEAAREGLHIFTHEVEDRFGLCMAYLSVSRIASMKLGNRSAIAHQLECFGLIAVAKEEPQRATRLFGAAEALREKIQTPMVDHERREYERSLAQLCSMLAEQDFNSLLAEGHSLTLEQALSLALE